MTQANSDYVHFEDCGCEKCLPYMHEDELPADMPRKDYDEWFKRSWIPGGVGCRVGPIYPFTEKGGKDGHEG